MSNQPCHTHTHTHGHDNSGHHGGHSHGHGHHANLAEANRDHFTENVDLFVTFPGLKELVEVASQGITNNIELNKDTTSALDFACGTGLIAKKLLPYVKSIVGVDISPGPIAKFNEFFEGEGTSDQAKGICGNIEDDEDLLKGQTFDLIYCSAAYHHFEDPESITKKLAALLKPDGVLVVLDRTLTGDPKVDTVNDAHKHIVARIGFSKEDMEKIFDQAGLKLNLFEALPRNGSPWEMFLAKATFKAEGNLPETD